jgi:hypothetical protein
MTKSMKALLVGAALTGFVAGSSSLSVAQDKTDKAPKAKAEKHCCKGQNKADGKGGCGATKGKAVKAGESGCATAKSGCAGKPCSLDDKGNEVKAPKKS